MKRLLGPYFKAAEDSLNKMDFPMSFLSERHTDVDAWRESARAEVKKLLSFYPPETPMDELVLDSYILDGVEYRLVSYAQPYGPRTEGYLLRPENTAGKLPGVLGLHDHGGHKYYGKEKITKPKNSPAVLNLFKETYYENRAWAHELAKRGYAVFVPDHVTWGTRKIRLEDVPDWYYEKYEGLKTPVDSDAHVYAYNSFATDIESDIAKACFTAGMTFPGMMLYDDMRAIDYLSSQPDVDEENIGCGGLSGGGLRTVYLAGMDERVKASVCVGFMTTSIEMALYKVCNHTWMFYLPGLTHLMDFTDLYTLRGKKPTMVLYGTHDAIFTPKGQEDSNERFKMIFGKMNALELYDGRFYPGPHRFDVEMQEDAFDFFDKWLK